MSFKKKLSMTTLISVEGLILTYADLHVMNWGLDSHVITCCWEWLGGKIFNCLTLGSLQTQDTTKFPLRIFSFFSFHKT